MVTLHVGYSAALTEPPSTIIAIWVTKLARLEARKTTNLPVYQFANLPICRSTNPPITGARSSHFWPHSGGDAGNRTRVRNTRRRISTSLVGPCYLAWRLAADRVPLPGQSLSLKPRSATLAVLHRAVCDGWLRGQRGTPEGRDHPQAIRCSFEPLPLRRRRKPWAVRHGGVRS